MSFIEHLDRPDWKESFQMIFTNTLNILNSNIHQHVGSATDDLRAWFRVGGINRVKEALETQMDVKQYSEEKKKEVFNFLENLIQENHNILGELVTLKIIPGEERDFLGKR